MDNMDGIKIFPAVLLMLGWCFSTKKCTGNTKRVKNKKNTGLVDAFNEKRGKTRS